jgi:ankyrin repeat protein
MTKIPAPPQELIDQFVGNAHGNFAVVKELLEQTPDLLNANASWDEHAIEAAAQAGQVEIVEYLLDKGAPLDICTAAMLGRVDQVKNMLQADPNLIDARGAHGIPLMYFPVICNHRAIADFLFGRGAQIDASSPGGITPLHGAVMFDQVDMAAWLLDQGANPNPLYDGKTPLGMAIGKEQHTMASLLRERGGTGK